MARTWNCLRRGLTAPHARLGWQLLVIGGIAWQMFGRHADWSSVLFLRQPLTQAKGRVLDVTRSGLTIGGDNDGRPVRSVRFEFADPAGKRWTGRSWTDRPAPERGTWVPVEFLASRPEVSRIVGFRSGPFPLWAGGVLVFPLFGVICLLQSVLSGGQQRDARATTSREGGAPRDQTQAGLDGATTSDSTLPATCRSSAGDGPAILAVPKK